MSTRSHALKIISLDEFISRMLQARGEIAFLLGAGCSKSAGVPTASKMIDEIREKIGQAPQWNPTFSEAMRALGPTGFANNFIARAIDGVRPGQVHHELADCMNARAEDNGYYISTIFTTNFDALIERQLFGDIRTCVLVANEQAAQGIVDHGGVSPRSDRCFVVKLHGDSALESAEYDNRQLGQRRPANRQLLYHWCSQGNGLVIVGYRSGDVGVRRVLMDAMETPAGFRHGLIYVLRAADEPPDWIVELNDLCPSPGVELLRVRDAEELFTQLRPALTKTLPRHWKEKLTQAARNAEGAIELIERAATWHGNNLYQQRPFAEQAFECFVEGWSARGLLYVGRSGAGKSILLSQLCRKFIRKGEFAIWYRAANWNAPGDLERALTDYLHPATPDSLQGRLIELGRILNRADVDHRAVIFIDGVNEASDPPMLVDEITRLLNLLKDTPRIRAVVSCREETFARYEFVPSRFYSVPTERLGASGSTDKAEGNASVNYRPDPHATPLGEFTESELAAMWRAYAELHHTRPATLEGLPRSAMQLARRNPLLLRLLAQAFSQKMVPEGLSSLVLFRQYFDLFVDGDPPFAPSPTVQGEARLLNLLVEVLADLNEFVVRRYAPSDQLERKARDTGVPWEARGSLISKGILEEIQVEEKGQPRSVRCVGFVFDRMLEFALAVRLHGQNYAVRGEDLERLLKETSGSAALWGAARVLIHLEVEAHIRRIDPQDKGMQKAALWLLDLLREERTAVRGLVTDALAQLGEEDPDIVTGLCLELLQTGGAVAGHVAVAVAVKDRLVRVILTGCSLPDRERRRRAAQGAVYLYQQNSQLGRELWLQIAERSRVELTRSLGNLAGLVRTLARVLSQGIRHHSVDELYEKAEQQAPTFFALVQIDIEVHSLALGSSQTIYPLQEATQAILKENLVSGHGDLVVWIAKEATHRIGVAAVRAEGLLQAGDLELALLRRDRQLRDACQELVRSWDDSRKPLPFEQFNCILRDAARGGFLASYAINGALLTRLQLAPEEAVEAAGALATSEDPLASYHGLTACGRLVAAAIVLPRERAQWLAAATALLESSARQTLAAGNLMIPVFGKVVAKLDIEHLFLARLMTTGEVQPLVEEFLGLVRDSSAEAQLLRALGALPRLGFFGQAVEALGLWKATAKGDVLEALAETIAEMMAAYPSYMDGWLEQTVNPVLEHLVQEKLPRLAPEGRIYRNGQYTLIALGLDSNASRDLIPAFEKIFRPARDVEEVIRLVVDVAADLVKGPFLRPTPAYRQG